MSDLVSERPIALNFPEYARIVQTDVALSDMSTRTISVTVKIDGDITPDFSYDWKMSFRGQIYILPIRDPQAVKENTSTLSEYDLTFTHEAIYKLQGEYYIGLDTQSNLWDKYDVPINLTLPEFVAEYDKVLVHLFGGSIRADLNPASTISEQLYVAITNVYMWDLLQQVYEVFGCRWFFAYDVDTEVYTIKFDYPSVELSHIFQYGYEGGLLNITKGVQSSEIYNYVLGRGGSQNIPYRYFKDTDENDPLYRNDPDWVEELALVYFSELRSKEFRDYVQGYKVYKKEQGVYPDYERVYEPTGRSSAYYQGYQNAKAGVFDPVEYVIDEESIAKYGVRKVKIENNEEAYPSIQGVMLEGLGRIDEVVAVEQVLVDEATEPTKLYLNDLAYYDRNVKTEGDSGTSSVLYGNNGFRQYKKGDVITLLFTENHDAPLFFRANNLSYVTLRPFGLGVHTEVFYDGSGSQSMQFTVPEDGSYTISWSIQYQYTLNVAESASADIVLTNIYIVDASEANLSEYKQTFDIWLKNLWQTTKLDSESDEEYVERVWTDILGEDNEEAMVSFNSSTFLRGTDLEFMVVKGGVYYDTSKTYDGVPSEWRLTLAKSTTEVENGGLPIPNTAMQGQAGDLFFFTGIELPQQYVEWGEMKVQDAKFEYLQESSQIQPSWDVSLDKVRAEEASDDAVRMIDSLDAGVMFRLYDEQLIDGSHFLNIYIQSITMSWGESDIIPETSFVLTQDVTPVINPVSTLQGDVEVLKSTVVGIGNIQKEVRKVGDLAYLFKNGLPDISASPTTFKKTVKHADTLQSEDYREGAVSGVGWSLENRNGRSTLEVDDAVFRGNVSYNNLVINQITVVGGKTIECAAHIECNRVDETETGYVCYFDQRQGSIGNLFQVDDVAYSSVFDANNIEVKSYKRKVVAVDVNSITISNEEEFVSGSGIPSIGDVICHYGNYTNKDRQYIIERDIIGGGHEKMIGDLDSVHADGYVYRFVGIENGRNPREQFGDESRGGYRAVLGDDGKVTYEGWFDSIFYKAPTGEFKDIETASEMSRNMLYRGAIESIQGVIEHSFTQPSIIIPNAIFTAVVWVENPVETLKIHVTDYDELTTTELVKQSDGRYIATWVVPEGIDNSSLFFKFSDTTQISKWRGSMLVTSSTAPQFYADAPEQIEQDAQKVDHLGDAMLDRIIQTVKGLVMTEVLAVSSNVSAPDATQYVRAFLSGLPNDGLAFGAHPQNAYNVCLEYYNWINAGKVGEEPERPNFMVDDNGRVYSKDANLLNASVEGAITGNYINATGSYKYTFIDVDLTETGGVFEVTENCFVSVAVANAGVVLPSGTKYDGYSCIVHFRDGVFCSVKQEGADAPMGFITPLNGVASFLNIKGQWHYAYGDFVKTTTNPPPNFIEYVDGRIKQYGTSNTTAVQSFATAFPTMCEGIIVSTTNAGGIAHGFGEVLSRSTFRACTAVQGTLAPDKVHWMAWGY